ncbi:hypothetical protein ACFVS2_34005 [Brevibacillus sp. NPDC058079]|uniref:hypothetical protein n=1 Tax=Brevibacillus sp. NPDC058079 TaxID=3346330 RepID=UPI0036EBE174
MCEHMWWIDGEEKLFCVKCGQAAEPKYLTQYYLREGEDGMKCSRHNFASEKRKTPARRQESKMFSHYIKGSDETEAIAQLRVHQIPFMAI